MTGNRTYGLVSVFGSITKGGHYYAGLNNYLLRLMSAITNKGISSIAVSAIAVGVFCFVPIVQPPPPPLSVTGVVLDTSFDGKDSAMVLTAVTL